MELGVADHNGNIISQIEYPINDNGQTYGSALLARDYDERPDLIAAIGRDGQAGYIYKTDLEAGSPKTPAEALAQQQQYEAMAISSGGRQVLVWSIPLYDVNGKTIIYWGAVLCRSPVFSYFWTLWGS